MKLYPTTYTIPDHMQNYLIGSMNNLQHIHKIHDLKDKIVKACCTIYANTREAAEAFQSLQALLQPQYTLELQDDVMVMDKVLSDIVNNILSSPPPTSMEVISASATSSAQAIVSSPPFSPEEIAAMAPHKNYDKFLHWVTHVASSQNIVTFLDQYLTPENVNMPVNLPLSDSTMLNEFSKNNSAVPLIELFANKGANFNHVCDIWKNTPLMWAIANGCYGSGYAIIRTGRCNFMIQDVCKKTPLHLLVAKNYINVTRAGEPILYPTDKLIEAMMDQVRDKPSLKQDLLDSQDMLGNTALHIACMRRDIEVIKLLLKEGARTNIVNNEGHRPLDMLYMTEANVNALLGWMTSYLYVVPERLSDPQALQQALKLLSQ